VGAAALAVAILPNAVRAQSEESRSVAGGGISAPGWMGKVDAGEAGRGATVANAKLATMGAGLHVTTGPAITYWNPANKVSGDYKVSATFNESKYMDLNDHPHPYGIMIAGNNLDGDKIDALYCAAYGDGHFIFRGFSSTAPRGTFQLDGRAGTVNAAVNKAAGKGQPVKQEIAMWVKGDKVGCTINGTEVASYPKADVIGEGKLKTLDGVAGIRFAHNTDAHVSGFAIGKP
jgi:hypothetical protein